MSTHCSTALVRALSLLLALPLFPASASAQPRGDEEPAPGTLLSVAYDRKASGDLGGAVQAFEAAERAGADPQRVALEVGYARLAQGDLGAARAAFATAAAGSDRAMAAQARRELDNMPHRVWADLYADSYGWHRAGGAPETTDLVPTLRLRAFLRLTFDADLDAYVYAQATRDLASRGVGESGIPEVYADDTALLGGGLMLRLWQRRLGLFAQAGPALSLLDTGGDRLAFDARGGAFLGLETARCRPRPRSGVHRALIPCSDLYSEAVYVSRFDHNLIGFGRGRAGAAYLFTGPLAWQGFLEARAAADRNGDYYNNFADIGVGHRWRLLAPLPLDVSVGVHLGRYFGRENVDPAPPDSQYFDLWLQAATYMEL